MKYVLIVAIILSHTAIADQRLFNEALFGAEDTLQVYYFDPVVVTANKIEVARSSVTASVSVLSADEIGVARNANLLTSIHTRLPSVFVRQRGILGFGIAAGSGGQIHIRGVGGMPNTGVLVLIDGRPQFMGLFGHPIPDTYLMGYTDRVEIIRGPASVLYGTNAMGGVVNIITRQHRHEGWSGYLTGSYGTHATQNYSGTLGYGTHQHRVRASFHHNSTDGHRPGSDFTITGGHIVSHIELGDNLRLQIDGSLNQFEAFDPGPVSNPHSGHWVDVLRGNVGFSLENRFTGSSGAVQFIYSFGNHKIFDGFRSNDFNASALFYQTFTPFRETSVTAGIDYKRYGGEARNVSSELDFGSHAHNELGIYLFSRHVIADRIYLTGGLRFEQSTVIDGELVPHAGIAYRLYPRTTLRSSVSKGFRSPTMNELYMFPPSNRHLKPERVWNYELGVLHALSNNVTIDAAVFQLEGGNIIRRTGVPPNVRFENTGRVLHRGFEFSTHIPVNRFVSTDLSYTFLDPGDNKILNPRHALYTGVNTRYRFISADVSVQYVSRLYDQAGGEVRRLSDYALVNSKFTIYPNDAVSVFLSIENVFDVRYEMMYGYPIEGRLFFTGIRIHI